MKNTLRKLVKEHIEEMFDQDSSNWETAHDKESEGSKWLDKKMTSRELYPSSVILKKLDEAIMSDDWDIIHDITNNISFKKVGVVPPAVEELGSELSEAIFEEDWHKVSVARKKFKDYLSTTLSESVIDLNIVRSLIKESISELTK
jgi:hypothetical protein